MNFFLNSLKFEKVSDTEQSDDPFDRANDSEDERIKAALEAKRKRKAKQIDVLPVDDLEAHMKKVAKDKASMKKVTMGGAQDIEEDTISEKLVVKDKKLVHIYSPVTGYKITVRNPQS